MKSCRHPPMTAVLTHARGSLAGIKGCAAPTRCRTAHAKQILKERETSGDASGCVEMTFARPAARCIGRVAFFGGILEQLAHSHHRQVENADCFEQHRELMRIRQPQLAFEFSDEFLETRFK